MTLLKDAVDALAARCDGATTWDGAGFNKIDAGFGRRLSHTPESDWTAKQRYAAYEMLRKYTRQLSEYGIDYSAIERPGKPAVNSDRRIDFSDLFQIFFDYNEDLLNAVRGIPGRRFSNNGRKFWTAPDTIDACEAIKAFAAEHDFTISDAAQERLDADHEDIPVLAAKRVEYSSVFKVYFPYDPALVNAVKNIPGRRFADNGEKHWEIPKTPEACAALATFAEKNGFAVNDSAREALGSVISQAEVLTSLSDAEETEENLNIPELGGTLRPFQEAAVAYALKAKKTFLGDVMGLGKTVEALATLRAGNAFPAVVVCPASLKYNWLIEALKWLPGVRAVVLNGKTPARSEVAGFDVVILNYDILGKWLDILTALKPKAVVLDESHYIKNHKAKRTKAAKELCKRAEFRLFLTGTPILNRPQELLSQLSAMGKLNDLGGFWYFAKRYCQAFKTRWGWDLSGSAYLDELNEKMRATCYVRREKKDVLKELPEKTRTNIPIEIDNRSEYDEAEANVIEYAGYLAAQDKAFQNSIKHLGKKERQEAVTARMQDASYKAEKAEQLVRIEVLKQVAVKGKMAAIEEWIESFLDTGEKLVVFGWHKNVVDAIAALCKCKKITGDTPAEARQKAVDAFQNDPAVRTIACNIQAGGVGITLTASSNVAFLEFGWNPATMDQAEDRLHRIGQTNAVNVWNLAGINTIDEDILDLIESKRGVVDAATVGAGGADLSNIIDRIKKRQSK